MMLESTKLIADAYDYGRLIAFTCINHPELEWHAKNIAPLECQKIFFNLYDNPKMGIECDCALNQLIVKYPNGSGE